MPFSFVKKCTFRQKFCHKSRILPLFSSSENEAISAVYNCYWWSHILWSLAKTVRGFWLLLFSKKKTGYCWILGIHRFQRILPPKMPFFVRHKVHISSKILPQIPNFSTLLVYLLNFVKFRQKSIFSSFRQFSVKNEILWSLNMTTLSAPIAAERCTVQYKPNTFDWLLDWLVHCVA